MRKHPNSATRTVAVLTALGLMTSLSVGAVAHASAATITQSTATNPAACQLTGTNGVAAANGARVDVLDTSAQILPAHSQAGASSVSLCQARNGYASFQIEVTANAATSLSGVSMTSSALTGPGGAQIAATNIELSREAYVTLTTMSDGELSNALPRDSVTGKCTGDCRFPDALIPDTDPLFHEKRDAFPFAVPAGENRVVWADVLVPTGQAPGVYTGSIAVNQTTGAATVVPISLTVVNASIPSTSTDHSAFFISLGGLHLTAAQYAEYAELGLDDRISIVSNNPLSSSDLTTYVAPLLKGTDPKVSLPGASLTDFPLKAGWTAAQYASYKSFFATTGQTAKATFYCDEYTPANCASYYATATAASAWPGLPLLATDTPESGWPDPKSSVVPPALTSGIEGVIALAQYVDPAAGENPYKTLGVGSRMPAYSAWRSAGATRQVWDYSSCMSGGCGAPYGQYNSATNNLYGWPSYGIDQAASEQQAMGWQMFSYGIDGEEYWDTTSNTNIWTDPYDAADGNGVNGDGTLFYPYVQATVGGTDSIPLESIRLKRIRGGRQDYELLKLAKAQGSPAAALAAATFPNMSSSSISGAALDSAEATLLAFFPTATVVAPVAVNPHDLDCNGTPDFLAVQAGSGKLLFYPRTQTDWTPNAPISVGTGFGASPTTLTYASLLLPGDLNGDGSPDLLGRRADGSMWLMPGNCTGTFGAAAKLSATTTAPISVGDFNGDGRADLLDKHADGTLWMLPGLGNGQFGVAVQVGAGWANLQVTGVGDLNQDGDVDLAARQSDGTLLLYEGNGAAGWKNPNGGINLGLVLSPTSYPSLYGVGDLSGDKLTDLVAVDSSGTMWRYNGNGATSLSTTSTRIGGGWTAANLSEVAQ